MAPPLHMLSALCAITIFIPSLVTVDAKVREINFTVSYMEDSPDGVTVKHVLGINNKFPGPLIEAEVDDILQITVFNNISNRQNTTIHWHGIHQRGTPFEDGPSGITQCPIKVGDHQTYTFPVPLAGTYWYHSHVNSQYTEGLWGILIVHRKPEVRLHDYDDDLLITLNDWYHTSMKENEKWFLSPASEGAPPYPFSVLMNAMGRYPCNETKLPCSPDLQVRPVFRVQPGKTYRVRVINTAGWTAFNFTIEDHKLRAIEADGVDTVIGPPIQAVHISAGQRYSFLMTIPSNGTVGQRSLIRANIRVDFLFTRQTNINNKTDAVFKEVTGVLEYTNETSLVTKEAFNHTARYEVSAEKNWTKLEFLDDLQLVPLDKVGTPPNFDRSVVLNISFINDANGIRRSSFNDSPSVIPQGMPELAMMVKNVTIPKSVMPEMLNHGEVMQVVINNPALGPHPIHLHGHHFWVLGMGHQGAGDYDPKRDVLNLGGFRRDTTLVKEKSWLVIRFKADNPGVWLLHCHIDWHMLTGMLMTFVEAPELADRIPITDEARRVCRNQNVTI